MTIRIRPATAADAKAIRAILLSAFPTAAEADLVERLIADSCVLISLVAEQDDVIVGHLLLSRMNVSGDGRSVRATGLAPVAVLPDAQRSGVGSRLIAEALSAAAGAGEDMIFVLGDPDYYDRFGFSAETAAPFASPYSGPHLQAVTLRPDVPIPQEGSADYAPAFSALG